MPHCYLMPFVSKFNSQKVYTYIPIHLYIFICRYMYCSYCSYFSVFFFFFRRQIVFPTFVTWCYKSSSHIAYRRNGEIENNLELKGAVKEQRHLQTHAYINIYTFTHKIKHIPTKFGSCTALRRCWRRGCCQTQVLYKCRSLSVLQA